MWLALDWGQARIGVAICDPEGILAFPVETVKGGMRAQARLLEIIAERSPVRIIVGLPRTLDGDEGIAAAKIRRYAQALADETDVPVYLLDERLTTVEGARRLQEAGRSARQQRAIIDQAAAVAILEHALKCYRRGELGSGELLSRAT